jgi:hypothetical protein
MRTLCILNFEVIAELNIKNSTFRDVSSLVWYWGEWCSRPGQQRSRGKGRNEYFKFKKKWVVMSTNSQHN